VSTLGTSSLTVGLPEPAVPPCHINAGILPTGFGVPPDPASLPCLISNNSTRNPLSTSQSNRRKTAFALEQNIIGLINLYGMYRIGVLTLTFPDHVIDRKEANDRFNSLATHVLTPRYLHWLVVYHRRESGCIHFHLIVVFKEGELCTGGRDYLGRRLSNTASPQLKAEWAFWHEAAKKYGFGRTELRPVQKNGEALGKYYGAYIKKHLAARLLEDKGARLVRYSKNFPRAVGTQFGWVGPRSWVYRKKVQQFLAKRYRASDWQNPMPALTEEEKAGIMRTWHGPRWLYKFAPKIIAEQLNGVPYPTVEHAAADGRDVSGIDKWTKNITFND
jgi:hypothetical protein